MELVRIARRLREETASLTFTPPVQCVYRPLEYAWAPHRRYLERYGSPGKEVLLLGMNPGPFGMVQTGVPFGDVGMVRDWLGIEGPVEPPPCTHPRRPVLGFACPRGEVSGRRLWGWARERFGTPARFFSRFFVWNYCPLAFVEESGRNRTPDRLPAPERAPLWRACDRALADTARALGVETVVGVGRFAADRARAAFGEEGIVVGMAPHPSPASPLANRGWAPAFEAALQELGIALPGRSPAQRT